MIIEEHPLKPFLPANAKMLFLGSFPPPKARWSMEFFYPNWINDFWRIMGVIHANNKAFFEMIGEKRYDKDQIIKFCNENRIALFDTARKVRRLKNNADDNFLEIIEGTDVFSLLEQIPKCRTIVTTGGKASEELHAYFELHGIKVNIPKIGECIEINDRLHVNNDYMLTDNKYLQWWRMPSSSRAYPMKLEKKTEFYRRLFE